MNEKLARLLYNMAFLEEYQNDQLYLNAMKSLLDFPRELMSFPFLFDALEHLRID